MICRIGGTVCNIRKPEMKGAQTQRLAVLFAACFLVGMILLTVAQHRETSHHVTLSEEMEDAHFAKGVKDAKPIEIAPDHLYEDDGDDNKGRHGSEATEVTGGKKLVFAMDRMHPTEKKQMQRFWKEYVTNHKRPPDEKFNFNVTVSDLTSLDRNIIDSRPRVCARRRYDYNTLPKASVVVIFYNEALSMLMRTIHSILNRTPDILLSEIVLVDDASTHDYLKQKLDKYISYLPKVKLIRNKRRQGLIRSRLIGAKSCRGPVLVFLDAHTEANVGWLEPISYELKRHPNSIIQPFVDGIEVTTIQYTRPPTIYKGGFLWDLKYVWLRVPDHQAELIEEYGVPFHTPTLVGCAIAVDMKYFYSIGSFDDGLQIWGGENIELAFRGWQCGARVITVPCSRVGHIFKPFFYRFGKNDKEETVTKNLMRVADVWMDGMKKYFYAATRVYEFKRVSFNKEEKRSVQKRVALRKRLKCKNFEWYMHFVVPNIPIPDREATYYGEISNLRSHACFEVMQDYYIGLTFTCYEHKIIPRNIFYIDRRGLLRYQDKCVRIKLPKPILQLADCPEEHQNVEDFAKWKVRARGHTWGQLQVRQRLNRRHRPQTWCIMQVTNVLPVHHREQMPQAGDCEDGNDFQLWAFQHRFAYGV